MEELAEVMQVVDDNNMVVEEYEEVWVEYLRTEVT